ncbi:MAG: hypothetical protein HYY17_08395 [Planctomycetes bacterium]|nr:hypothetical protein [Planctomycetota bacterium]
MVHAITAILLACAQDTETLPCDTTEGWSLADLGTGVPKDATLSAQGGAVAVRYERGTLTPLACGALLTELRELRLTLLSESDAVFAAGFSDRDGAAFHHAFELAARKRTTVVLRVADFKLNDDSAVKKDAIDPARLGWGFLLLDAGGLTGARGRNTLSVDEVTIVREPLPARKGDLVVDREMEISASERREGNVAVLRGGRLRIAAPRFVLCGDLAVDGGSVEVAGGAWVVPQRYNHEREVRIGKDGRVSLRGALVVTGPPLSMEVAGGAAYEAEECEFAGLMSAALADGARVRVKRVKSAGEYVISPGAEVTVEESHFAILWHMLGPKAKGAIRFPRGEKVEDWSSGWGMNVRVRNSTGILFCLVSTPGSDAVVEDSEVYATGIQLFGDASVSVKDLHNGRPLKDYKIDVPDRSLRFLRSTVKSWTFYPCEKTALRVEKCTFGEVMAFAEARVDGVDSTCDGSGGYVMSEGTTIIRLKGCRIDCLVLAKDSGTIVLEDCEVTGDVRAVGKGTVRLVRCRVRGRIEKDPGATLTQE